MLQQIFVFPTCMKVGHLQAASDGGGGGGWIWGPVRARGESAVTRQRVAQRDQVQPTQERISGYLLACSHVHTSTLRRPQATASAPQAALPVRVNKLC